MAYGNCTREWEVYAFEASPVMHPFVESFVRYLNGQEPRPPITVPPVGGSIQMLGYAKAFGCPHRHNRSEYTAMYTCMNRIFKEPLAKLAVNPALNDSALIQSRLDEAAQPNEGTAARYTFVPAAVGAGEGWLSVDWPSGLLLYVHDPPLEPVPRPPGVPAHISVRVVDWVSWLQRHFSAHDVVVVKMDIEGAEHTILPRMAGDGSIDLIDVLGLECHGGKLLCPALFRDLTRHGVRLVSEAAYSPLSSGVDPFSHVKDMLPLDPRSRGGQLNAAT